MSDMLVIHHPITTDESCICVSKELPKDESALEELLHKDGIVLANFIYRHLPTATVTTMQEELKSLMKGTSVCSPKESELSEQQIRWLCLLYQKVLTYYQDFADEEWFVSYSTERIWLEPEAQSHALPFMIPRYFLYSHCLNWVKNNLPKE